MKPLSRVRLCDPVDCSPPGSSVHGDSPDKNTGVGCHSHLQGIEPRFPALQADSLPSEPPGKSNHVHAAKSLQLCATLCNPIDGSLPGSTPGILQARTLEWVMDVYFQLIVWVSLEAQMVKNRLAMRETWVQFLDWEEPLEEAMATHSSILVWRIPMDREAW